MKNQPQMPRHALSLKNLYSKAFLFYSFVNQTLKK